jgi:HEAT repeat protein
MSDEQNPQAFSRMVADYMEDGLLENIVIMFKHDRTLFPMVADLLQDERLRVRMGAVALVEALAEIDPDGVATIADVVAPLLRDASATIRGDAAYAVGLTGTDAHLERVRDLLDDPFADVREIAADAMAAISGRH